MKLLLVDDSIFVKSIITKTLKNYLPDLQIIQASNGKEGFSMYKTEKPDLILTDLLMPEMNGQEFLRLIRTEDPDIKIVVMSADIQKATRDELEKLNISTFFNKPFNTEKAELLVNLIKEGFNA